MLRPQATPSAGPPITRRLSSYSFECTDPADCATWLRRLGYVDLPRNGPREYARLVNEAGTIIIYGSALVIALRGAR